MNLIAALLMAIVMNYRVLARHQFRMGPSEYMDEGSATH